MENQGVLLEERERTVLEDSLLTALAQQIHSRVLAEKDLVAEMDADTSSKPMSSGMAIGISWVRSEKRTEQQAAVSRTARPRRRRTGSQTGWPSCAALLRAMIYDHRASNPRDTYREVLAEVLDYRSWHAFELQLLSPRWYPGTAHQEEALRDVRRGEIRSDPHAAVRSSERAVYVLEADVTAHGRAG